MVVRDGDCRDKVDGALRNLLIICRFLSIFLVVSKKRRTFVASYIN